MDHWVVSFECQDGYGSFNTALSDLRVPEFACPRLKIALALGIS